MTKNLDKKGLSSIVDHYDLFYIDLWGVVHNGIKLHKDAIVVLNELLKMNKDFVLLTNAPRPNLTVNKFLEKMGMDEEIRRHIFTSGEAALRYLKKFNFSDKFFHIGPPRDFDLFNDFKSNQSKNLDNSQYLLCTGLFEEHAENLNYFKELLKEHIDKIMICTNPDLIVDKGNRRELCAGSVALGFEKMGGKVVYFGKPFPEVYKQAINNDGKRVLSIGDNLNTDIKGANLLNFDSLIISNGVHRDEIKKEGIDVISKKYEVVVNFIQTELKW